MASSAAGRPGRDNEDFAGAVPTAAVLVDGAGGVAGAELACHHGVAWYATRLGTELLALLAPASTAALPAVLAEAIGRVTGSHRATCDVTDVRSPWAAVAILRVWADRVEHLVLGDAFVVLDRAGAPEVVTDPRELEIAAPYEAAAPGSAALREGRAVMRANRNRPGGYWVAKDDPRAATEAIVGSRAVSEVRGAALLSNGASRIVDRFHLAGWPEVLALLASPGPEAVIRRVRQAEARHGVAGDDATAVHCTVPATPPSHPSDQSSPMSF